jgi:hypothetical protein
MRPAVFGLLWSFTTVAAVYDAYFAWEHQNGFETWELNPFICWLAGVAGLQAVIGFKVVTTVFATGLAFLCRWRRHWLEMPLTLSVASIFFLLSIYYVIALKAPEPTWEPEENRIASLETKKRVMFRPMIKRQWDVAASKNSFRT